MVVTYIAKFLEFFFLEFCHRVPKNTIDKPSTTIQRDMSGDEIIERLKDIKKDVWAIEPKKANQKIDYLIDDIFMYKNNSL